MKTKLFSLLVAAALFAAASGQTTEPRSCKSIKERFPTKRQWQMAVSDDLCTKLDAPQKKKCEEKRLDILTDGRHCKW